MSLLLEHYHSKKEELVQQINRLSSVLQDMGKEVEMNLTADAKKLVLESQFQIVVVGEFARGKSTVINALLGKKLLPSSARPTTTLLNIISYSKEPFIKLHFNNGEGSMEISESTFKKLVAPKDPLPNDRESEAYYESQMKLFKNIKFIEIGDPLPFCEGGVQLVDTPGTNDLDPAREQLTNNIIPKADAAIFILSAVKILAQSEISLLQDRILASDVQKVFIVINFIDQVEKTEDKDKVYSLAYNGLKNILQKPKIYMVTAKQALNAKREANGEKLVTKRGEMIPVWNIKDTGFPELESALADFLQFERGAVKLQKPLKKMTKLTTSLLEKQIPFEYLSLTNQMDGLKEKVEAIRPKLTKIQTSSKESLKKIKMDLKMAESEIINWYERELQGIKMKGMETFDANRNLDANDITSLVEKAIAPLERILHDQKKETMSEAAKKIIRNRSKDLNKEWFDLESEVETISYTEQGENFLTEEIDIPSAELTIFDEIFDELDTAWENSNSFIGKVALGAGYLAAGIGGTIAYLVKALVRGESEKTTLRRKLSEQFSSTRKQRLLMLKNEYDGLEKAVYKQYQEIVNRNVLQMESQLNLLLEHTGLEEKEVGMKLEVLRQRKDRLEEIQLELELLDRDLKQSIEKAEV